jgi:hypothetical protein
MAQVTITMTGEGPIQAKLGRRMDPELRRTLGRATKASANALKPFIKAEAPIGPTRRLVGSIRTAATRQKPGAYVGPSPKKAPHRHFVVRGTSRGQRANPFVARGASRGSTASRAAFEAAVKAEVRR